MMRRVTLLGATGSVGESTLDVISRHPDRFQVAALAANSNWEKLAALCRRFRPDDAALLDPVAAQKLSRALAAEGIATRVLAGPPGML
jgi:1-deoxy-D-xylulose-5-phosphate reductoisomerase